ncbi:MAG: hypothetical protein BRC34_06215 [Cyanobacteria bacterium QH_1_48_107]|nr:MAG: hypothetical protein BRC34_06215 [Cyanobacteria bacterium QH_1_48_107]PSO96665.1 MAG: hypothetical protein BRC46_00805 [Cyanobacteria bacterium QS_6_48_18]PSP02042.1 MAG: hypothetical protein BRC51_12420 [Cyanobacteria bacterium SW_12_48_29]PSP10726.1 MAG: hypothetical protein BRC50_13885 [Cyanobacteria bacterium SW_11_48_12]
MNIQLGFILEVLIFSAGLSILIKYGGPSLSIPPSFLNALIAISLPPLMLLCILLWRLKKNPPPE